MRREAGAPNKVGILSVIGSALKIAAIFFLLLVALVIWYGFFQVRFVVIDRALLLPGWGVNYAYAVSYFYTPFHLGPWWVPIRFVAETLLIALILALDLGGVTRLLGTFGRRAKRHGGTSYLKHVLLWWCGLASLLFAWPAVRSTLFFILALFTWKPYGIRGVTGKLYAFQHLNGKLWGPATHPLLVFCGIWFVCVAGTVLLLWWPVRHLRRTLGKPE